MLNRVREGRRGWVRPSKTVAIPRGYHGLIVSLCALACTFSAAVAQPGGSNQDFQVNVLDLSAGTRSISVPLHQSVVVETSVKVARVDVVADQIADVRAVSPTELLVNGKNYGQTNVILWDEQDQQYLLNIEVELDLKRLSEALCGVDPLSKVEAKSILGNIVEKCQDLIKIAEDEALEVAEYLDNEM